MADGRGRRTEVLTAEITEITEMEMGGRGTFSHESHEFLRMEGGQEFLSTDFTDFHRWERGVLRNLKQAGTGIFLRAICANLCNLWITHRARFPAFVFA